MCYPERPGAVGATPLQPIPIGGPFHRVGVDVLKLPLTYDGNAYAVVFMDYFMKWPEVFAVPVCWWKRLWPDMVSLNNRAVADPGFVEGG